MTDELVKEVAQLGSTLQAHVNDCIHRTDQREKLSEERFRRGRDETQDWRQSLGTRLDGQDRDMAELKRNLMKVLWFVGVTMVGIIGSLAHTLGFLK